MNIQAILLAKAKWDSFYSGLEDAEKNNRLDQEAISSLDLFAHYADKAFGIFDAKVNTLPKKYLYDDPIIHLVCTCYKERKLPEMALAFIEDAKNYHDREGLTSSVDFFSLRREFSTEELFDKLKNTLVHLRNLPPENIPGIIPASLNGQYDYHLFILAEIITALRILRKKKMAIHLEKENFINDVLVAILKMRLPMWGWDITDQERSGTSAEGSEAGEVDCTITAASGDLTLIEAFQLKGKDTSAITKHVNKCFNYNRSMRALVLVVYFTGERHKFRTTWLSYQEVVQGVAYPSEVAIDLAKGFVDLHSSFANIENFYVAKTKHGSIDLFHIMIDLS